MSYRTLLAIAGLATLSSFCTTSAQAQQWAPAAGASASVTQRPAQPMPMHSGQVRFQQAVRSSLAVSAPAAICGQCGNSSAFCNCAPGACVNGQCPQGCLCANGQCRCANGQCSCAGGQCGCICPPGACASGQCLPNCPCPGCNGGGFSGAVGVASHSVSRPVTHTTLRRPVIADAPEAMVSLSL